MRVTVGSVAVLGILVMLPAPVRPEQVVDADRTVRSSSRYYFGAGGNVDLGGGAGAYGSVWGGCVMSESLLLGLEAGASTIDESANGDQNDPKVEQYFADAVVTWFPFSPRGAYLKGGLGYGSATEEWSEPERKDSESGVSALLSAGWEFRFSEHFGFGMELGAIGRPGLEEFDGRLLFSLTSYWGRRE